MQTQSTFAVIFFTRKSRSKTNQLSIYVRITVKGKRSEISLKRIFYKRSGTVLKIGAGATQKGLFLILMLYGVIIYRCKRAHYRKIARGIDNNHWVYTKREKTNETVKVPLLPKALEIINKYNEQQNRVGSKAVLPINSNQKTNKYLKEIAKDCGISKNITFHFARHTFATTVMLSNGVPIETVSKLLGHTKLSTAQIYAQVIESKISEEIQSLLKRMETNKEEQLLTTI